VVYFIVGAKTGLVKIGKAVNVPIRLCAVQAASPDRLTVLKVLVKAPNDCPYQKQFAASWSHSEWFNPTPDLLEFIATIPASPYDGLCIRVRNLCNAVTGTLSDADWQGHTPLSAVRAVRNAAEGRALMNLIRRTPPVTMNRMRSQLALDLLREGTKESVECAARVVAGKEEEMVAEYVNTEY